MARLREAKVGSHISVEHFELSLRRGWWYLINPGSVGQPRDGDRCAAFAIYDEARAPLAYGRSEDMQTAAPASDGEKHRSE
jgi:hypothetical protein